MSMTTGEQQWTLDAFLDSPRIVHGLVAAMGSQPRIEFAQSPKRCSAPVRQSRDFTSTVLIADRVLVSHALGPRLCVPHLTFTPISTAGSP